MGALPLLVGLTLAGAPTVGSWTQLYGPPSQDVGLTDRTRSADEPLLVYWMSVRAAPLGLGPALPGTLVANFQAASPLADSALQDFTFLAVADSAQKAALEASLREAAWISAERVEQRPGGRFRDLDLTLPDGRTGTLSIREDQATGAMADGRPAPSLWMHVGAPGD